MLLSRLLSLLGIDRAIGFAVAARVWNVLAGPVTIFLVATRFSGLEQGYYYTIGSLLALQVFFELGLMTVLAQFASHEFASLSWGPNGQVDGEASAVARFTDLLVKGAVYFGCAALLLTLVLAPAGVVFLGQKGAVGISWQFPWVLAVVGTACNLLAVPFFAVILGSGEVATVNHREMIGGILNSILLWSVISLGGGLYAIFAATMGNAIISWSYIIMKKRALVICVVKWAFRRHRIQPQDGISWSGEVWPMQWRIAVSAVAGYFIFQLFNPVLFHYWGSETAGRMGMTLTASNALLAAAMAWGNSKLPQYGRMVALRQWGELDRLFFQILRQSTLVSVAGAAAGALVIALLQHTTSLGGRFIPAGEALVLFLAVCVNVVVFNFANYLRAHKQEPLLVISVVTACVQIMSVVIAGKLYATAGVVVGYLLVNVTITLPLVVNVWKRSRRAWHEPVTV